MSDIGDTVSASARAADPELVEVFRTFETAVWAHINAPDTPADRLAVARAVAAELTRVSHGVETELRLDS